MSSKKKSSFGFLRSFCQISKIFCLSHLFKMLKNKTRNGRLLTENMRYQAEKAQQQIGLNNCEQHQAEQV